MKNSLVIVGFFIVGIALALYKVLPAVFYSPHISEYSLFALMFLVGIFVGSDPKTWATFRTFNLKILLVPLCVVVGSLLGGGISAALLHLPYKDGLLVSAGFGYYSLSSILITKYYSVTLGVVALLSNMIREVGTLLGAPLLAKFFGKLAPIASGGATTTDTTLPIIVHSSGKEYALVAVFSGMTLTILVPFIVSFLLNFL